MHLKILTYNWHEPYLCLLSRIGHTFLVIEPEISNGTYRRWDTNMRPIPDNVILVSEKEALTQLDEGALDLVIAHNIKDLIRVFNAVKEMNSPVLVHVYTHKGKGSKLAEKDAVKYYSVAGKKASLNGSTVPDYSTVFGKTITQLAETDPKVYCITAAMEIGTGLTPFIEKYPDRYVDVGIAEEHAVTYSSGLAAEGYKPIVPIYSTFMQRAYDHIFHDALLQNLPLVYCMDRSGVVGPDGPTHHGVFDLAFMQTLPGMIVTAPKDGNELRNLIATALESGKNFSIRYPKASSREFDENGAAEILEIGKWDVLHNGSDTAIFAVGSMVGMILDAKKELYSELGYLPTIVNARFIKPLDSELIFEICQNHKDIITIEEGVLSGGFGSAVSTFLHDNGLDNRLHRIGIPDQFVEHATRDELLVELGLCPKNIISVLKSVNVGEEVYEL